jgi:hypothetical protein
MSLYRKNPLFAIAMTLCAVLALGELALIYERYAASRAAAKRLAQRRADLESMTVLMPPPTREVATAIEADLAKAQQALAAMQGELKGRGPVGERIRTARAPAARTDAYFDLATFVEKSRAAATKHEVEIRPEAARFGFAAFANEGPMPDHIEAVFRQRQIAQYLVDALIEAARGRLFSVKREATLGKADLEVRAAAIANGEAPPQVHGEEGPDYFAIDPRVTARVPGFIDTVPFRFVFTGQTAALRTFLNRLASFELPVLVREVEVELATAEESAPAPVVEDASTTATETSVAASVLLTTDAPPPGPVAPKAARAPRAPTTLPIVAKTISKFTVTVEFVELVPPPEAPAPADAATPAPTT